MMVMFVVFRHAPAVAVVSPRRNLPPQSAPTPPPPSRKLTKPRLFFSSFWSKTKALMKRLTKFEQAATTRVDKPRALVCWVSKNYAYGLSRARCAMDQSPPTPAAAGGSHAMPCGRTPRLLKGAHRPLMGQGEGEGVNVKGRV